MFQLAPPIILLKFGLEYGLSTFEAGLLLLAFSLPYALLPLLFGALSRKMGRRRLLSIGFLFISFAFGVASFSQDSLLLMIALFVAGIGGSTYHVLGIPLIADLFPAKRGEALGYHQTGGSIGSFIAPLIVGALTETFGWRSASVTLSLLGLILAPILWYSLRDVSRADSVHFRRSLRELGKPLIIILATANVIVGFRGLQLFGVYYFDLGKGLGSQAYLLMSLSNVAGIISGPICGRLSDIVGRKKTIAVLALIEGASALGLVIFSGALLYFTVVVLGFAFYGLLATTDAYLSDVAGPELFGTVVGINSTASFTVSSILSFVLGSTIGTLGYDLSFTILAAFPFISLPILLSVRKPGEKTQENPK
jgi:MFS family permease